MPKSYGFFVLKLMTFFAFLTFPYKIWAADITAPVTTATLSPASPNGKNNWYVTPIQITLTATDLESGVKQINYKLDNGVWQSVSFTNTLNLAPNPSFETYDSTSNIETYQWTATTTDALTTYTRDSANYLTGYETNSVNVTTTGTGWHGINHAQNFAVATTASNMTASAWVKTQNVTQSAYFKIYAISQGAQGQQTTTLIGQSTPVIGTTDWTRVYLNFVVTPLNVIGIYMDAGLDGSGSVWLDAISISEAMTSQNTVVTVGADGNHTFEYYSIDHANNQELHNCGTNLKCKTFKIDTTPPGNWHDSGAFRGLFGSSHELYVYTNVEDDTSGLSVFTDKYQYKTDNNTTFGRYSNPLSCNSTWQPNNWTILISPPFTPGVNSAYLLTPKTDFCNSDWKICKVVRFYSEDMAGNLDTKDFCINGPWVRFSNQGIVRANGGIDMVAEANGDNTDGLIESGTNQIDFFTSNKNWKAKNTSAPQDYSYESFSDIVGNKTTITGSLPTTSGVYQINSNYTLNNTNVSNSYSTAQFSQIIFVNGDLAIDKNITLHSDSAALFVVKGNVNVKKNVSEINMGVLADGTFNTASDINEGESNNTLVLRGVFIANQFTFSRTLQGTNNSNTPSEDFYYEPKYLVNLKNYFKGYTVEWEKL